MDSFQQSFEKSSPAKRLKRDRQSLRYSATNGDRLSDDRFVGSPATDCLTPAPPLPVEPPIVDASEGMNPPPLDFEDAMMGETGPSSSSSSSNTFSAEYPFGMSDEDEATAGFVSWRGGLAVMSLSIRLNAITSEMDPLSSSFSRTAVAGEYACVGETEIRDRCMTIARHAFWRASVTSLRFGGDARESRVNGRSAFELILASHTRLDGHLLLLHGCPRTEAESELVLTRRA